VWLGEEKQTAAFAFTDGKLIKPLQQRGFFWKGVRFECRGEKHDEKQICNSYILICFFD